MNSIFREFLKGMALLAFVVGMFCCMAWFVDRPDVWNWRFRIAGAALAPLGLAAFLLLHFRRDLAPDFLRKQFGNYFERGGFCFGFTAEVQHGVCYLVAHFQNQHVRSCVGRIALRPAEGFFDGRIQYDTISFEIPCGPAAYGFTRISIPVPKGIQGTKQRFEVGAAVEYPQGRGRQLRFHPGISIRSNSKFNEKFRTAIMAIGAAGGSLILIRPATVTVSMPIEVAEDIVTPIDPEITTLWKLGDAVPTIMK
ncbi:MAG: hypothetical protein K8T25_10160 [Planctomycetia bacterium]|nr:hypothetical protein [Planctomycetia bacterium]